MCFDHDRAPSVFCESYHTARTRHICCECGMPILPGERYQRIFGIWNGDASTYCTCEVCEWFRERVVATEMEHGCAAHEACPSFGFLHESLSDGHDREIGLVDLGTWHEQHR